MSIRRLSQAGFTYVEMVIVSALTLLVFGAIFLTFQSALELSAITRTKVTALALANERMEYLRSLPYANVGVVDGFPSGSIPQTTTYTRNGLTIQERVRVDYVDDTTDGQGFSDDNSIPEDYKKITAIYTWTLKGQNETVSLSSVIVPRTIETAVGGGTVRVSVLDDAGEFLPGASVQLFGGDDPSNTYDVTNQTGPDGVATFSVPADVGYEVITSAIIDGQQYSTSTTHEVTVDNPIPIAAPFSVLEADISTASFQIGALSDLTISWYDSITEGSAIEAFSPATTFESSSDVSLTASALQLQYNAGGYPSDGDVILEPISPTTIDRWEVVRLATDTPTDTSVQMQFYTVASSSYVLIPDADLPGNSTGFIDVLVDISALSPTTYPTLWVGLKLQTSDSAVTPQVDEVAVYWREETVPAAGEEIEIRGDKLIGTQLDGSAIYKTELSATADSSGVTSFPNTEFDTYTVSHHPRPVIASACPSHPFVQQAGVDSEVEILLSPNTPINIRVVVEDLIGRPLPGATIDLARPGITRTFTTNTCGQAYADLTTADSNVDHTVTVSLPGFNTQTLTDIAIQGDTVQKITLTTL